MWFLEPVPGWVTVELLPEPGLIERASGEVCRRARVIRGELAGSDVLVSVRAGVWCGGELVLPIASVLACFP